MASRLDLERYIEAANMELVSIQAESSSDSALMLQHLFRITELKHGITNAINRLERLDEEEDFNRYVDQMAEESYWQDLYERGIAL